MYARTLSSALHLDPVAQAPTLCSPARAQDGEGGSSLIEQLARFGCLSFPHLSTPTSVPRTLRQGVG
jgi:hypothetical protein